MTLRSTMFAGLSALALLIGCGSKDSGASNAEAAQQAPSISVKLASVETRDVQSWIFAEGTARATSREFLSFDSAGRIAFVDPDLKEGDAVSKGQVLAYQQQDRPEADLANARARTSDATTQLSVAEASTLEAAANLDLAEKTFERYRVLLEQRSASQQEYDEAAVRLEQARAAMIKAERQARASTAQVSAASAQFDQAKVLAGETRLVSPIDGVVARLNIEQGYYFSPQTVQTTSEQAALNTMPIVIIDPSQYEIRVDIPSLSADQITTGSPVLIEEEAGASRTSASGPLTDTQAYAVRGEVYAVSPSIDPATRTFQVRLRTLTGEERLRDGEFVTSWIAGPRAENAMTIPQGITRFDEGQAFVFVYDSVTSRVTRTNIQMGLQGNGTEQVLSGLIAGMQVVTEGRSKLSDGDRVRVIGTASSSEIAGDVN